MNDTRGAGRGPPDDKTAGSRRPKATAKRITASPEEAHDADIVTDLAPAASQFRPVGAAT